MNEADYWERRSKRRQDHLEQLTEKQHQSLGESFRQAQEEVQNKLNQFYARYAKNNGISYGEAQRQLSPAELRQFRGSLQEFEALAKANMGRFNLEVENRSVKARVTRYQALMTDINGSLERLYGKAEERIGKGAVEVFQEQYHRTLFDLDQERGSIGTFAKIPDAVVRETAHYPFNGLDYSQRIWRQRDDLSYQLQTTLNTMLVRGGNPYDYAKEFAHKFGVKQQEAYRLLYTEYGYMAEQAQLQAYREDGVESYRVLASLDTNTCLYCQGQDRKVYPVAEAVPGVNLPLFHPWCHCTTVPEVEGDETGTRAARDPVTGKSIEVPETMTYGQWKEYFEQGQQDILDRKSAPGTDAEKEAKARLDKELSQLPSSHQKMIEEQIKKMIFTTLSPSGYNPATKTLRVKNNFSEGDMIHEAGHVLADSLGVYEDAEFLRVLEKGLESIGLDDIIYDEEIFVQPIIRIESPKLISLYQGRMYEDIGYYDGRKIHFESMLDYFSEGYREYFQNPANLQAKDPDLYDYIRKLVKK